MTAHECSLCGRVCLAPCRTEAEAKQCEGPETLDEMIESRPSRKVRPVVTSTTTERA